MTEACITIPIPPPPTPTPTPTPPPTPTPTPPPCDSTTTAACQEEQIEIRVGTPLKPFGTRGGSNIGGVAVGIFRGDGTAIPNRSVELKIVKISDTGGHFDTHHTGSRPIGTLEKARGTTRADGIFVTKYNPSHISGFVTIEAKSGNLTARKDTLVAVLGLTQLFEGENFRLIGSDSPHPSNHWGSAETIVSIPRFADAYKTRFYGSNAIPENDKLRINDISLIFGGKFDLQKCGTCKPDWLNLMKTHKYHREGNSVDMRCCSSPGEVPANRHAIFERLVLDNGATNFLREYHPNHFHLSFNSETNNRPEIADPLTVHTPSSFITNVWEAVFGRFVTQEEYEPWHDRLANAKKQGIPELLAEAKVFERELFASQEYVFRYRTEEDFVKDVFLSYLFREPTEQELQYWLNQYYSNMPPVPLPEEELRQEFLRDFESMPEFESLVSGIIDGELIMPPLPTPRP